MSFSLYARVAGRPDTPVATIENNMMADTDLVIVNDGIRHFRIGDEHVALLKQGFELELDMTHPTALIIVDSRESVRSRSVLVQIGKPTRHVLSRIADRLRIRKFLNEGIELFVESAS